MTAVLPANRAALSSAIEGCEPAAIAKAFEAVGRDVPHADRREMLAAALDANGGDIEGLWASIANDWLHGNLTLRETAQAYRAALLEAADPTVWATRLLTEANERVIWAIKADKEAAYRQESADRWRAKGDERMAEEYASRARSEANFAAVCRAHARAKRAQAKGLLALARAEAA